MTRSNFKLYALGLSVFLATACGNDDGSKIAKNPDAERGRAVFLANCIACHNNDPSRDGAIGPAIKGSPRELLEARVLTSSYPPNYRPKRPTKIMPQFPFLRDEIPYLAAYLAR
jgi:mono/diheme cytochrome c family protein